MGWRRPLCGRPGLCNPLVVVVVVGGGVAAAADNWKQFKLKINSIKIRTGRYYCISQII